MIFGDGLHASCWFHVLFARVIHLNHDIVNWSKTWHKTRWEKGKQRCKPLCILFVPATSTFHWIHYSRYREFSLSFRICAQRDALKQASYEERPYDSVQPPIIDLGLRAPPVLVLFQKLNTALHVEEDCVQAVMPATIVCIAPNRIATWCLPVLRHTYYLRCHCDGLKARPGPCCDRTNTENIRKRLRLTRHGHNRRAESIARASWWKDSGTGPGRARREWVRRCFSQSERSAAKLLECRTAKWPIGVVEPQTEHLQSFQKVVVLPWDSTNK